jgi:UDP-3-O-[3-hydroxymyristoyl] glucosamine N-acyltransferase
LVRAVATLEDAGPGDLAFLTNPRYREAASRTRAGAILVAAGERIEGHDLLEVAAPYVALAEILEVLHPAPPRRAGISPDARLAADVRIGRDVEIGPFAVLGAGVSIGDRSAVGAGSVIGEGCDVGADSVLAPRVVLYPGTRVGARCTLHAGVVLGADGFGFAEEEGRHRKIPQVGRVVVEDDVEIGANSTVDRAAVGETVIGRGTKIDDLVMVAHGVRIGPDCLLVGQSGIAGSTRLGSRVTVAGQSGAAGHLSIGDGVVVAAKSAVFEDVPARSFVAGIPATDHRSWKRQVIEMKKISDLRRQIRELGERLDRIESRRRGGDET